MLELPFRVCECLFCSLWSLFLSLFVEIAYCANVSVLGLDMLVDMCPALTRLDVHGCDRLDDAAVLYLIRKCRTLR